MRHLILLAWLCALGACSKRVGVETEATAPAPTKAKAPEPVTAPVVPQPAPAQLEEPSQVAKGAELYGRMCAVCHGAQGEGYKADQATALAQPDFLASVSDDFLGYAIAEGRAGTTMSAWYKEAGGPLSVEDIRALLALLRSWQKTPSVTLDEAPARGVASRGKEIFARECERCHGAKGPSVRILARQWLAHTSAGFVRHALLQGRPPTEMKSFRDSLGTQGIEDIVAYLRTLPAWSTPDDPPRASRPPPIPLGPVPLNPKGKEPKGFRAYPEMTSIEVVAPELARKTRMVILDARVPSDYELGHIAGAVSVPFYDPAPYLEALPKSAWLVCYCGCPHAESGQLAEKLVAAGFSKVTVLDEGLWAWSDKGYPMSKGRNP